MASSHSLAVFERSSDNFLARELLATLPSSLQGVVKGKHMMTVMEAKAEAVARVLAKNANAWAKSQADDASRVLQDLLAKGQISPADFAQAITEVSGNHSAMRQSLEKHGMLASTTAMPAFLVKAQERLGEINREIEAREKANADERAKMAKK